MLNIHTAFSRLLIALCLCAGSAMASPVYHIDIDTSTLGSGPAYLGLSFLGLGSASAATATVEHLAGALDGAAVLSGTVTGSLPGALVFSNANGGSELVQGITLGGLFSFDVTFLADAGDIGTTFNWALFSATDYLGAAGDLGSIFLQPQADGSFSNPATLNSSITAAEDIPEPSVLLLVLLSIAMLTMARRRR